MYPALILAGGFGTRMRPITDLMPKPLVPVGNEPNLRHIIRLLCNNGCDSALLTVSYMKEMITETLGDCCCGVDLGYIAEDIPLGTAGAGANAADKMTDDFIIISGDIVCDFNLSDALEFHKLHNAGVTVITHRVCEPLSYGVVLSDKDGRITRFCEKPSWAEVFSDRINTGIYIINKRVFKYVPEGVRYDFSRDLFPKLLDAGEAVYAFECDGYWKDIGCAESYLSCNLDALDRAVRLETSCADMKCAHHSVVPGDLIAGAGTEIYDSVIMENVTAGENCSITGSVICNGVTIGRDCVIKEGCVIGAGAVIESGTVLTAGSIVKCGERRGGMGNKSMGVLNINGDKRLFHDGEITVSCDINGIGVLCAAAASFSAADISPIGVCVEREQGNRRGLCAEAQLFAHVAALTGQRVYYFGQTSPGAAVMAGTFFDNEITVYFCRDIGLPGRINLKVFDKNGLCLVKNVEEKIESFYRSGEAAALSDGEMRTLNGLDELYFSALTKSADLSDITVSVIGSGDAALIADALSAAGADILPSSELYGSSAYMINASDGMSLLGFEGQYYSFYTCLLIILTLSGSEELPCIALPYFSPNALSRAAAAAGIKTLHYLSRPSCEPSADREARELAASLPFLYDRLFCAVKLMEKLKKSGLNIRQALEKCEPMHIRLAEVKVSETGKASLLRELYEMYLPYQISAADGISVREAEAEGMIMAGDGDRLKVMMYSYSMENAESASEEIIKKIKKFNS